MNVCSGGTDANPSEMCFNDLHLKYLFDKAFALSKTNVSPAHQAKQRSLQLVIRVITPIQHSPHLKVADPAVFLSPKKW